MTIHVNPKAICLERKIFLNRTADFQKLLHTEFESENQTFLESLLFEKNEEIAQLDSKSKTNERYGNELRFTEELVNEKKGNIVSGSDLLLLLLSNNDGVGQIKIDQKPEVPIKPFSISKYDKCLEDEKNNMKR